MTYVIDNGDRSPSIVGDPEPETTDGPLENDPRRVTTQPENKSALDQVQEVAEKAWRTT